MRLSPEQKERAGVGFGECQIAINEQRREHGAARLHFADLDQALTAFATGDTRGGFHALAAALRNGGGYSTSRIPSAEPGVFLPDTDDEEDAA